MPYLRLNQPPPTYATKTNSDDASNTALNCSNSEVSIASQYAEDQLLPSYAKDWALNALFRKLNSALEQHKTVVSSKDEGKKLEALKSTSAAWKEISLLLPQCDPVAAISCLRRNKFFAQAQGSLKRISQLCESSSEVALFTEFSAIGSILRELRSERYSHSDAGAFLRIDALMAADLLNSTTIFIRTILVGCIRKEEVVTAQEVFEIFLDIWNTSIFGTVEKSRASTIFSQACLASFISLAAELRRPESAEFVSLLNDQVIADIISPIVQNGTSAQSRKQLREILKAFTKEQKSLKAKITLLFSLTIGYIQNEAGKSTAAKREISSFIFTETIQASLGVDLEAENKKFTPSEESNELLQGLLGICVAKKLTLSKDVLSSAAIIFSGLAGDRAIFWKTIKSLLELEPVIFIENENLKTKLTLAISASASKSDRTVVLDCLLYFLRQFAQFKSLPDFLQLWGKELEKKSTSHSVEVPLWLDETLLSRVSEYVEMTMIAPQISQQIRKYLGNDKLNLSSIVILPCLLQGLAKKNHTIDLTNALTTILSKLGDAKLDLWLKRRLLLSLLEMLSHRQLLDALSHIPENELVALVDSSSPNSSALDKSAAVQIELKMIEIDKIYGIDTPDSTFSSLLDFRRTKALSSALDSGSQSTLDILFQIIPRWLPVLNLDALVSSNFITTLAEVAKTKTSEESQKKAIALWRWVCRPEALDRLNNIKDAVCDAVEALLSSALDKAKDVNARKESFLFAITALACTPVETLTTQTRIKLLSRLAKAIGKSELKKDLKKLDKQHIVMSLMHFSAWLATAKLIAGEGKDFIKLVKTFMSDLPSQSLRLFSATVKSLLQHREEEEVKEVLQSILEATLTSSKDNDSLLLRSACIEEFWSVREAFESVDFNKEREAALVAMVGSGAEGKEADLLLRSIDRLALLDTENKISISNILSSAKLPEDSTWSTALQTRLMWHSKVSLEEAKARRELVATLLASVEKPPSTSVLRRELMSKLSVEDYAEMLEVFSTEEVELSSENTVLGELLSAAAQCSKSDDPEGIVSAKFTSIFNTACKNLDAGLPEDLSYNLSLIELFIHRGASLITYTLVDTFLTTASALLTHPTLTTSTFLTLTKLAHSLLLSHHPLNCGRASLVLQLGTAMLSLLVRNPEFTTLLKTPETSIHIIKLFTTLTTPLETSTTTKSLLAQAGASKSSKPKRKHRTNAEARYRQFLLEEYVRIQMSEVGGGEVGELLFGGLKTEDFVKAGRRSEEGGRSLLGRMVRKRNL